MNQLSEYKTQYLFPRGDFFTNYIKQIAKQSIHKLDNTNQFIYIFESTLPDILEIFTIDMLHVKKKTELHNVEDVFPTTKTITKYSGENIHIVIILERMYNGHLGCDEDDLKIMATFDKSSFEFSCYIFESNRVQLTTQNCSKIQNEKLGQIMQNKLGLMPT